MIRPNKHTPGSTDYTYVRAVRCLDPPVIRHRSPFPLRKAFFSLLGVVKVVVVYKLFSFHERKTKEILVTSSDLVLMRRGGGNKSAKPSSCEWGSTVLYYSAGDAGS